MTVTTFANNVYVLLSALAPAWLNRQQPFGVKPTKPPDDGDGGDGEGDGGDGEGDGAGAGAGNSAPPLLEQVFDSNLT